MLLALLGLAGCKREPTPLEQMGLSEEDARKLLLEIEASNEAPAQLPPSKYEPDEDEPRGSATASFAPPPPDAQDTDPELTTDRWIVDGLVDVTTAAPSTAHPKGVFVATRGRRLLLASLGELAKSKVPAASPISELPDDPGDFGVSRGPSVTKKHAYWVSDRDLCQAGLALSGAAATVVANDARVATRVSAISVGERAIERELVAYIGLPQQPDGPLVARLWISGETALTLTDAGSAALSVQLARQGSRVIAYSLEGRTSMSILHAREVELGDTVRLLEDRVIWVGGAATPTTELRVASGASEDVFGLLPIEQDSLHFGLALFELSKAKGDDPVANEWAQYKNGMDYSPTSADVACGVSTVVFARPSAPAAHAPQELVLAELVGGRLERELVLARSKVFYDTSIAGVPGGALVSYVADRRTWARTVRCKSP
jgi:hypothetical protein